MAAKKLCLIDAYNQIHRAYHALPELSNADGLPTNAVYGFTTMLRRILQEERPDYCAVVFDAPGRTVRHEAYEQYKSSRPELPEDLRVQIPWVRRVCEAMRIPVLELSEYEADDVIGTLARAAERAGLETVIVSEDKDLLQLVDERTRVRTDRTRTHLYDRAEVERKFGVAPERMTDLLGLMGDSIDDIPGVPGIGPKRARELIERYGSLEQAIAHAHELDRYQYGRNLAEHADRARLSKELATVHTDLDLDLGIEDLAVREPDAEACREVFSTLGFRRLLEEFAPRARQADGDYSLLPDEAAVREAFAGLAGGDRVALLLLYDHPEPMRARPIGAALAPAPGRSLYVPLGHEGLGADNAVSPEGFVALLSALLAEGTVALLGHDLKSTLLLLGRFGLDEVRPELDVMLASYVLHPTRQSHALEPLAHDLLGLRLPSVKDLLPDRHSSLAAVPAAEVARFAGQRADALFRLAEALTAELAAQPELDRLLRTLEMPLMLVLADMERRGVRIDVAYLRELAGRFAGEIAALQQEIYELAGGEFNINSPKQLGEVLFDRLQLPAGGRTATGGRSTKAEVLEALAAEYPIARKILEYRELSKLKSTYLDALPACVNPDTGRVHASFDQAVAATGRLSSSNPNLQNIPVRTATGRQIRRAFIPAEGSLLLTADYSQIELRILAHLSGDPALRAAFAEGHDIHRATAAEIFGVPPEQVSNEQRDRAKVINFGVLYGMGPQRLAREFGITPKEARAFIDRYLNAFPRVKEYLERTVQRAREEGYVTTMLGRVRHLPELQSGRPMVRSFGERIAVNTPIQGTAADLIKLAMVNLHARLAREGLRAGMIIQVHDELVLEVPEADLDAVRASVREEMEGAIELDVPLVVEIGVGANWMEAKG